MMLYDSFAYLVHLRKSQVIMKHINFYFHISMTLYYYQCFSNSIILSPLIFMSVSHQVSIANHFFFKFLKVSETFVSGIMTDWVLQEPSCSQTSCIEQKTFCGITGLTRETLNIPFQKIFSGVRGADLQGRGRISQRVNTSNFNAIWILSFELIMLQVNFQYSFKSKEMEVDVTSVSG